MHREDAFWYESQILLWFPRAWYEGLTLLSSVEGYRIIQMELIKATKALQRKWRYKKFRELEQRRKNRCAVAIAFYRTGVPWPQDSTFKILALI